MQARKQSSHGKITTVDDDFSGDDSEPSNQKMTRNSTSHRRRLAKQLNKRNLLSKQNQTAETLEWLSENYELVQGVCVPRCVLYTHYLDFCKKKRFSPAGPATFGKLIRQRFPKLTTRRLGTRGQSKYHYYGISIKESSVYYHSVYSGKGLTRFSSAEERKKGVTKKFPFGKNGGNTLPEFPNASEMNLNGNLSVEKVETFIIMYRTHCQRLLDTVMNANFNEVHKFLLHFWRGMPEHMVPVLECDAIVDVIVVCDSLLYKIFNDVLVPSCIQDIPDSLTDEIQDFAVTFVNSLETCLVNTPVLLKSQKLRVARNFVRLLKRNMTFINLAQTARPVFLSYESMSGILNEFRSLDMRKILSELLFLTEQDHVELPILSMFMEEFENLLVKQAPIEAYAEWFDNIVEEYVLKDNNSTMNTSDNLSKNSQSFLTTWSFITSRILQELTLKSSPTFGSFQLVIMMFEEYILLIIESQMVTKLDEELKLGLTRHLRNSGEEETNRNGSKTQDEPFKQRQEQNSSNKLTQKTDNLKQTLPATQDNLTQYAQPGKDQQIPLFYNFQRDLRYFENAACQQPDCQPQNPYEVQKNSYLHFSQQGTLSQCYPGQIKNLPSNIGNNLPFGEVYLGTNAPLSEICRIENSQRNAGTQDAENNYAFSRFPLQKNAHSPPRNGGHFQEYKDTADKNQYETYTNGQGQLSQGQFSGHQGQGQIDCNDQYDYLTRGQREIAQFLYGDHVIQGESQSSNQIPENSQGHHQGHLQSQVNNGRGRPFQGQDHQNQSYQNQGQICFKNYHYESQIYNVDHNSENQSQNQIHASDSLLHENINYTQTSNSCSDYHYTESVSVGKQVSQGSNLTYSTTQSSSTYQQKTTLPSFYQLSSQLSSNSRLSAEY